MKLILKPTDLSEFKILKKLYKAKANYKFVYAYTTEQKFNKLNNLMHPMQAEGYFKMNLTGAEPQTFIIKLLPKGTSHFKTIRLMRITLWCTAIMLPVVIIQLIVYLYDRCN